MQTEDGILNAHTAATGDTLTKSFQWCFAGLSVFWGVWDTLLDANLVPEENPTPVRFTFNCGDIVFLTLTQLFSSPTVPFWDTKPIEKMTSAEKWVYSNWMVGFSPVVLDLIFLFGTGSMEKVKVSESVLSRDVDPAGKVVCSILGRLRQGLGIAASVIGYRVEPRLVTWDGIVSNVVSPIPDSCMRWSKEMRHECDL